MLAEEMHSSPLERYIRHMRLGEFEAAWQISDSIVRDRVSTPRRERRAKCLWGGTALSGKQVWVRCHHGLGDTIQFARYVPLVKASAAEVTVCTQRTLISLLERLKGIERVLPLREETPKSAEVTEVEIMELPYIFRTTLDSMPAAVPYFELGDAPAPTDDFSVGIAWRGGCWDRHRDVPFSLIRTLADVSGATFYALQKYPWRDEYDARVKNLVGQHFDGLATARVMRQLHLVISIDSMPAHLAGALGLPVWTLLRADSDWRWMENRDDSPWYPTMRLFRQRRGGEWEPVIERVAVELDKMAHVTRVNGVMS
ncbi:MAG TPA: ADP-heptose--LPS heptosyltransferase [Candidatus Binatia bacterium]